MCKVRDATACVGTRTLPQEYQKVCSSKARVCGLALSHLGLSAVSFAALGGSFYFKASDQAKWSLGLMGTGQFLCAWLFRRALFPNAKSIPLENGPVKEQVIKKNEDNFFLYWNVFKRFSPFFETLEKASVSQMHKINQQANDYLKEEGLDSKQYHISFSNKNLYGFHVSIKAQGLREEQLESLLKWLLQNAPHLRSLSLYQLDDIDGEVLLKSLKQSHLISLSLHGFSCLKADYLLQLVKDSSIRLLKLPHTPLDEESLSQLREFCVVLDSKGKSQVLEKTNKMLGDFRKGWKTVHKAHFENRMTAISNLFKDLESKHSSILKLLKEISFAHITNLTDLDVFALCRSLKHYCPFLKQVSFEDSPDLSDDALTYIKDSSLPLENLNLRSCVGLSDACIDTLIEMLPKLRTINLTGCNKISFNGILKLERSAQACSQQCEEVIKIIREC